MHLARTRIVEFINVYHGNVYECRVPMRQYIKVEVDSQTVWWLLRKYVWNMRRALLVQPYVKVRVTDCYYDNVW